MKFPLKITQSQHHYRDLQDSILNDRKKSFFTQSSKISTIISTHYRLHLTFGLHCIGDLARVNCILSVYHYFSGMLFQKLVHVAGCQNFPRIFSTSLSTLFLQLSQNALLIESTDHHEHCGHLKSLNPLSVIKR